MDLDFLKFKKRLTSSGIRKRAFNYFSYIFNALFLSALALSFSGGLHAITFRSIIFIVFGSITGYLFIAANNNKRVMTRTD